MPHEKPQADLSPPSSVRLDVFLDVSCLFRTRSQAAAACKGGKVDLNGQAAAPHRHVKPADRLQITVSGGKRTFLIRSVSEHHVPKSLARTLYEETTPPVDPGVLEMRRLIRLTEPVHEPSAGRPGRRERRERERLRGF